MSKTLERIVSTPAEVLDRTISSSRELGEELRNHAHFKKAEKFWHNLGPGLTTGAADDDPSGITTYSQAGAQYGFQLLWLSGYTFPLMAIVQEMCARIGLVTGRGLAGTIRKYYPRWVLYTTTVLLFVANTLNIGADLGAMAKATQLLWPQLSFGLLIVGFTVVSLALQIFTTYEKYARYLKWLALILFSYILSAASLSIDWGSVLFRAVVPSLTWSKEQLFLVCGILGTTISPYLFFWQTSQEVEEEILEGKTTLSLRRYSSDVEVKNMRIDVWFGMFFSNIVMFFIIAAAAATLGGKTIMTAADAAVALRPIAGDGAYLLFALGIIGTGMLAVPVLSGAASYAVSESFRWRVGLYRKLKDAYAFYGVIIVSMAIGLVMNFIGIDPIKALIYSAVVNGLIAPVILILVVQMSSSKKIMGERANHPLISGLGWLITGVMIVAGVATIITLFS